MNVVVGFSLMVLLVVVGALVVLFLMGFRVCQEYERSVVFLLGRFRRIKGPGLYWNIPFLEWQNKVDLRVVTVEVERQESITKDSVTVKVNAVLWFKVIDPAKAILTVANFRTAVYQVALTSLRNVIGQHVLDEVLKERDKINDGLKAIVDQATEPWGVTIEMVEMKDVEIPEGMQRAMAQEAQAVREKRARIIKAEAELDASHKITEAAQIITEHPAALELRRMQMITEVGAEQNTTTIVMLPSEFVSVADSIAKYLGKPAPKAAEEKGEGK